MIWPTPARHVLWQVAAFLLAPEDLLTNALTFADAALAMPHYRDALSRGAT